MKCMALHLCFQVVKNIAKKVLPNLVEKKEQWFVLPKYNKMKFYNKI